MKLLENSPKVKPLDLGVEEPDPLLSQLRFQFPLRRYQQEIVELIKIKVERGEKELHIVAPPGAGKTIIGLHIVSQFKCPSIIISPNTTIQAQWGQKAKLFLPPELEPFGLDDIIGNHEDKPLKPITLLTYQVLSTPSKEIEYLEKLAHKSWLEELAKGLNLSQGDAEIRILEILQNNPKAYRKELGRHVSRLRRKLTEVLDLKEVLHGNAIELLQAFRRQQFGLVIFDECHHLTDYWAAVMTQLIKQLDNPYVIGLTGTPPEGKSAKQETRYLSLVGEIDYQVPTPALIKDGGLAPFQDLVYFTEPTEDEYSYLAGQHEAFHLLLDDLTADIEEEYFDQESQKNKIVRKYSRLTQWILSRTAKHLEDEKQSNGKQSSDRPLLIAMGRYLFKRSIALPKALEANSYCHQAPFIDDWMLIIEDFCLHCLKLSQDKEDHDLYERINKAIRSLGYGLSERGIRKQASPVDRVLAFSKSKAKAVANILDTEYSSLQDNLRVTVVTDFEKMASTSMVTLKGVLTEESGGALNVFKELLDHEISNYVNPALVTGSLLWVDKRIGRQFELEARAYLEKQGINCDLVILELNDLNYTQIYSASTLWQPRIYVAMATELFERGITKCLIGTRGIFGEGWDSQSLNTLIDMTTTASPVSVKQLRGRAIRINTRDALGLRKAANNWDIVCIAPSLEKGLNDYARFVRKHDGYFGIADDGQIECSVSHVHAALSELTPAEVFASAETFNREMLDRSLAREQIYELWKVGQPYTNRTLGCVEVKGIRKLNLTPPHIKQDHSYKSHAQHLRSILNGVWLEYGLLGGILSGLSYAVLTTTTLSLYLAFIPFILMLGLGIKQYKTIFARLQKKTLEPNSQLSTLEDMACALLFSLKQAKLLPDYIKREQIVASARSDGSYRVFLDGVETEQSNIFARCFQEIVAPVTEQPYLIPKYEFVVPKDETQFFKNYLKGKTEPRLASYHGVPKILARSERGRNAFEECWNKFVSPGLILETQSKPDVLDRYFGMGPSLAQRLIWE